MGLNLDIIETELRTELLSHPSPALEQILWDVREAISEHVFRHKLRPRDVFQMRIMTHDEQGRQVPPKEQTYLIINFWKDALHEDYLDYLRSYYGKIIPFHIYLNHSLIL